VAPVPVEHAGEEPRYIGGDLPTLLHTVQLGTIAVNAWHSRVGSLDAPDYCVLDLDPGPEAPFARVVRVAQWVRAALDRHALAAALKSSGSRGLHILVPLPAGSSYDASAVLAERIAERIAAEHPEEATVARALSARAPGQVYVDHLQNARGKTLASVYAVRARPQATVSTPLSWRQLARPTFDPTAFTARTVPRQLGRLARRWEAAMRATNPPDAVERALAELS
jgi:bifunctional non-homologous end joining protein LigD